MKYLLNLATGTYVNHRRVNVIFFVSGIFLVGLLIVNSMSIIRDANRTQQLELRLNELRGQKQGANMQKEVDSAALAEMAQRINVANQLLVRDSYRWTALLDQLEDHLSDGVSINGLQPDYKSGVLKLTGVAATVGDLRKFIDNLSRSKVFTHVYLKDQRTEKLPDEVAGGILFSIELQRRSGHES